MVNVNVPCAVGVPEIVTEFVVLAERDRPPGRAPEAIAHVKDGTPPDAVTVALYAPLVLAEGRDVVVIDGRGSTAIISVADWFGYVTEVAVTVTFVAALTVAGAL
jgi:hypothetical protein